MTLINNKDILAFHKMLTSAAFPVIITHMKPDGDAVGSTVALLEFIRLIGREGMIVLPHRPPQNLHFLIEGIRNNHISIHEETPAEAEESISRSDLIICLDFNAFHRTDKLEEALRRSSADKVLIDHHLNPDKGSFSLTFSKTDISSASELLFHILIGMPEIEGDASRLPEKSREALMTGMTTDTNNFANSVYPSTLQMASSLLAAGTDRDKILSYLYNSFSESRLRLMGHMMKDLMTITEDGVAYIVLDRDTLQRYNVAEGDTEGFVNMPLSIAEVRMSLLLKEDKDRIRVSIRSRKGVSANRCAAAYFNGGGHENAAGGRLIIPEDISSIAEAGDYIERTTHIFLNEEDE